MSETELKFDIPADAELPDFDGLVTVWTGSAVLRAGYWDTIDLRLLDAGITLRHRQASDGSECRWTLKVGAVSGSSGAVVREELSAAGPATAPPDELTGLPVGVVGRGELGPVASITTDRRTSRLGPDLFHAAVEVADDRVSSVVGAADGPAFRQVEVELLQGGGPDELSAAAHVLRSAGCSASIHPSKLARVLQIDAAPVELEQDGRVGPLVTSVVEESRRRLVTNDPLIRLGRSTEAVHVARVATRRLRSQLKLLRPVLDPPSADRLLVELKWLGGLLGEVRDSDVLLERLSVDAAELAEPGDITDVLAPAEDHRDLALSTLVNAMSGDRYLDLLESLGITAANPPLRAGRCSERARRLIRHRTRKAWSKVDRSVAGLGGSPTAEDLHELRKEVKHLRYAAEMAHSMGLPAKRFRTRAKALQDSLGDIHDDVTQRRWLIEHHDRLDGPAAFLAGRLHARAGERRARGEHEWQRDWRRLDDRRARGWMN